MMNSPFSILDFKDCLMATIMLLLLLLCSPHRVSAAGDASTTDTATPSPNDKPKTEFRLPTLGGSFWWIDTYTLDGYRIQTHKITGWRRLIDPANILLATGTYEHCANTLAKELLTPPEDAPVPWNIETPTLGGAQIYGDEFYGAGWKIQRNAITGHYRLIDPDAHRQAWGTYAQCYREFQRLVPDRADRPHRPLVLLIHGILRGPGSFETMKQRLTDEGYAVCSVSYPSSQATIETHASQVSRLLERLEETNEIYVVGHSMGGLIIRKALQDRPDPRIRRIVTLGTPHHGALEADMLKDWFPFKVVFGPSGQQLISQGETFVKKLTWPDCPVGCIAGGKGDDEGYNPLLPGDDDGTVSMSSALPEKAADTFVVQRIHSFIMDHPDAIEATVRFLRTGQFREQ